MRFLNLNHEKLQMFSTPTLSTVILHSRGQSPLLTIQLKDMKQECGRTTCLCQGTTTQKQAYCWVNLWLTVVDRHERDKNKYHNKLSSPEVKSGGVVEIPVVLHRSDLKRAWCLCTETERYRHIIRRHKGLYSDLFLCHFTTSPPFFPLPLSQPKIRIS